MNKLSEQILFFICTLFITMNSIVDTSERQSRDKPDQMLEEICEKFHDDGLSSIENKRWLVLCEDWSKVKDHRPNEEVLNGKTKLKGY